MKSPLAEAHRAYASGRDDDALSHLLAAWRASRHPRVAALVEAVSARALTRVAPVGGTTEAAREKAWRARAKAATPGDVGALLAALTEGVKVAAIGDRVERLGDLDADPRVATRYVAMLRTPPFTASSHRAVWTEVLRQLAEAHADPRAADAVAALAPTYTQVFGDTVMGRAMQTQLTKLAAASAKVFPAGHPSRAALPDGDAELATAFEAALAEAAPAPTAAAMPVDEETALLRAIADDPGAPGPRRAYLAWAAKHAPERAAFITAQAQRHERGEAPSPDDAKQVKRHAAAWLGPLAEVVREPRFAQGFLVECLLHPRGTKTGPAVGDPRWATVETLHCTYAKNYGREVILHPVLRGVRHLRGAPAELVRHLLEDPTPRALETLEGDQGVVPQMLSEAVSAPGLMGLRDFAISSWFRDEAVSKYTSTWQPPSRYAPFLKSPLAARLEVLRWTVHQNFFSDALATLDAEAPPTFRARVDFGFATARRDDTGRWRDLTVTVYADDGDPAMIAAAFRTVRELDPAVPSRITVTAPATVHRALLAKHLDALRVRFPQIVVAMAE